MSQPTRVALLSVTDKKDLVPFAQGLVACGFSLLSTGGTASALRDAGLLVTDVATLTGSPECLGGRVKTLHPKVHGGILFDRADPAHQLDVAKLGITPIDLVVVNLYQFAGEAVAKGASAEEAIHHIDIGGPAMLRAAAKNWQHVTVVASPQDYDTVLQELRAGGTTKATRQRLAAQTFAAVSAYDQMIARYLAAPAANVEAAMPRQLTLDLEQAQHLRYGENPHQAAGLYRIAGGHHQGFADLNLLSGKELSYNNILDLDAATALSADLAELGAAVVIVKHTNPCGVAVGAAKDLVTLFKTALAADPKSAFGGIVALSTTVDQKTALALNSLFLECVAAPDFTAEALATLQQKAALRVVKTPMAAKPVAASTLTVRSVHGAYLVQGVDASTCVTDAWRIATKKTPNDLQMADLRFAMIVAKHVKSNAIVFARDLTTVAVGAGQMSRIDAANTAVAKAAEADRTVAGSVLASDAFFPFRDTVDFAAKHGVAAVVQPGGSKRDQDSVDAANEHGVAMVLTGERHFRH